jgi:hypothetical protein
VIIDLQRQQEVVRTEGAKSKCCWLQKVVRHWTLAAGRENNILKSGW